MFLLQKKWEKEVDWIAVANQVKLELVCFVDDSQTIKNCNVKAVYQDYKCGYPQIISIAEPKLRKQLVNRYPAEVNT